MEPRRRVLVTGGAGVIGQAVHRHLGDRYELAALDRVEAKNMPTTVASIDDLDAITPAFAGIDAVVHLAASITVDTPWDDVLHNNLIGTYNVYEAARRAGAKTIVFASSNHAIGMYEMDAGAEIYELDDSRVYDHTVELRPDSLYGVSKAYGEALGRMYSDLHGMRVHCLRIGTVRGDDDPRDPSVPTGSFWLDLTPEQKYDRLRATWLSQRDCADLIGCCLEAADVPFGVVYAISNNPRQFWDMSHAKALYGFTPKDSAPE